jgi:hypothetical protein
VTYVVLPARRRHKHLDLCSKDPFFC